MPRRTPKSAPRSFDEAVLECRPLRDAMYRHLTPSRGLRRAVTIGCVPLRAFPAVVGWLAPWDIVSPTEAALRVTQLDLNVRGAGLDVLDAAAKTVHNEVAAAGGASMETSSPRPSPAPFSKLTSLTICATAWFEGERFCHAARLLLQSLPAVKSLAIAPEIHRYHSTQLWFAENTPAVPIASVRGMKAKAIGAETIAGYRGIPRVTSLDIRGFDMRALSPATFTESLLLCRGTLRTVTCGALDSVATILPRSTKSKRPAALQLCLAHEAPTCTEPVEPELTTEGRISRTVVTRVPVHWTLECLVVHERRSPPMAEMLRLIAFCPKLQEFSIHVDGPPSFWSSRSEVAFAGRVLYRSKMLLFSSEQQRAPPRAVRRRPNVQAAVQQKRPIQQHGPGHRAEPRDTAVAAPPDQLELMNVAHWYARCVLSTFEADPSVLSPGLAQHRAPLQGIISTGEYPAALLWALCRGPSTRRCPRCTSTPQS